MAPPEGGWHLRTFSQVLQAAISDLADRGYASRGQIEEWQARLRAAADRELLPGRKIDQSLRVAMETIYRRLIERGGIAQYVPGVGRFTLASVRPALRAELDRRILASVDLIKLHRREAIEKTLQRFSGWSTSIPPGGGNLIDKRSARVEIGKSVRDFSYERRRVAIDQGHKLIANVAEIVGVDNGAIAGVWHSHWRQANYDYRPDHKARDGKTYAVRGSWAIEQGLINKGAGYIDDMTRVAEEPFCRCYMTWVSSLRRVPDQMLTRKGQEWIARGGDRKMGMAA